jgi:hypothetical protein
VPQTPQGCGPTTPTPLLVGRVLVDERASRGARCAHGRCALPGRHADIGRRRHAVEEVRSQDRRRRYDQGRVSLDVQQGRRRDRARSGDRHFAGLPTVGWDAYRDPRRGALKSQRGLTALDLATVII